VDFDTRSKAEAMDKQVVDAVTDYLATPPQSWLADGLDWITVDVRVDKEDVDKDEINMDDYRGRGMYIDVSFHAGDETQTLDPNPNTFYVLRPRYADDSQSLPYYVAGTGTTTLGQLWPSTNGNDLYKDVLKYTPGYLIPRSNTSISVIRGGDLTALGFPLLGLPSADVVVDAKYIRSLTPSTASQFVFLMGDASVWATNDQVGNCVEKYKKAEGVPPISEIMIVDDQIYGLHRGTKAYPWSIIYDYEKKCKVGQHSGPLTAFENKIYRFNIE